ncbi:MAG TPA: hypothetical protein VJ761_09365 [Ktedonobacteraceae bacterium]|nr:hypothetical protein [Ktedonobacteraceae bacterium]
MAVPFSRPTQEIFTRPARPGTARFMTLGFLAYTLLILTGHVVGFPLSYAFLHTVCPRGCALTPGNVLALERVGLSITFYANLYLVIQVFYILLCIGIAMLIVFKKPGRWVPLGLGFLLVWLSAYEGANYPALVVTYPALNMPVQLLLYLAGGIVGSWALVTFPNGRFGARWILGFYLISVLEGVLAVFVTAPIMVIVTTVFSLLGFPMIVGILIYRSRRLLNAKEQAATKWVIVSLSLFIPTLFLVFFLIPAVVPADSFALLIVNFGGFFGCGINIAGILMAVLYANAFEIDVFVRRTLVYTLLTATLVLLYVGMIVGSQFVLATFSAQAAQSPVILVASTLVIAALFQPFRHGIQRSIDRRFYRRKYDAAKTLEAFSARLRHEVDLSQLSGHLLTVVEETMQPSHASLWLRPSPPEGKATLWRARPLVSSEE